MPTVTFIGAGSMVFARRLIGDVLSFPELADSTIRLMDIDEGRLAKTTEAAQAMVENDGVAADIQSTTDRRQALEGADYVLDVINVGGSEPFENEIRIPERYGVEQAIGDTLGPGGVFRGLRTIQTMLEIARDMEDVCPDALLLNYTNPMAIVCWAMAEATEIETVGLCHSVPHTAEAIAEYVDVPREELDYWVAGVNHMAWFLECEHDGEDVHPRLEEAMDDPDTYRKDTVRFEMMRHFGAFITESSHHLSEYVPYFRTDQETIEEMAGEEYAERMPTASYLEGWKARSKERDASEPDVDPAELEIERSEEYASRLIHSLETGEPRRLNLDVPNADGAITNLPQEACVEVPCLVDGTGIRPCTVGDLPPQMAALNRTQIAVQERAVTGALENDREAVHHAIKLDPLTAAALTLEEAHEMTEELIQANREYLPELV
ncbi:alpha-glucosidase/alpha-galactosidase [Halalkalicoccus salilacus]|uniref:alpha-glucosidase/alpha-galactosidase n=1 Tax=Halalkalicoccus TaxID=332246 RepID=UPI002F9614E8